MNDREIIELLRTSADPDAEASTDCLTPEWLAAFHEGVLAPEEGTAAEAHLAACDHCLRQLATLSLAAAGQDATVHVPVSLINRAEDLFTPPVSLTTRWQPSWAMPLAAAAALVASLALLLEFSTGPGHQPDPTLAPQSRYADHELSQPRLLAPAEGSVIQPLEQVFRWTEVPGALFYDVRLVNLEGDLLLRERTAGTSWLIPASLQLNSGEDYFVRVDAWLSDAKYLSSEHRVFRVEDVD